MGVIAKKRNGEWWLFINHRGQRKAKKVGSKEAAKELKGKIEARLSAGDLGILEKPGITFTEAADRWLEGYVKPCLKPRSYDLYSQMAKRFLLPALGSMPLRDITRSRLKDLLAGLHTRGLSRRYCNGILATVSGILHHAVEDGYLDHNPAARLGRYTRRQGCEEEAKEQVKYWTGEQVSRILARTQQEYPEWHDPLATMAWAGFRVGEALGLKWDDIDFEERAVYVRRIVYELGRKVRVGLPKGNRGRKVEMAERLVWLLTERKSRMEAEAALSGKPLSEWVFPGKDGQPAKYHAVSRTLAHVLDLERIPRYGRVMTHAFRHSWATWILQNAPTAGAIPYVSRQLGHSSVKMTLDVYSHVIPEENRHLADRLAEMTAGAATTRNLDATEPSTVSQPADFSSLG